MSGRPSPTSGTTCGAPLTIAPGLGHFILTGSAVPPNDITRHTGAGRMSRLRLRPMSLFELGAGNGDKVSLKRLLEREPVPSLVQDLPLPDLATLVCVGGWPGHFRRKSEEAALLANRDYLDEVRRVDIRRVGPGSPGIRRELAGSSGRWLETRPTCASVATMARDVGGTDPSLSEETGPLLPCRAPNASWVLEQQPPWAPHLRSRSRLRSSPKRHFTDPSLATAALNAGPENLMKDIPWFGLLFESMVVRDLRVYAQAMGGSVYHYRDNTGLEVDALVDAGPGRWVAFEVKLGQGRNRRRGGRPSPVCEPYRYDPQRSAGGARRHHGRWLRISAARWRGRDPGGGAGAVRRRGSRRSRLDRVGAAVRSCRWEGCCPRRFSARSATLVWQHLRHLMTLMPLAVALCRCLANRIS